MKDYQLKYLIYTLYCNNPKLRQLAKDGVININDMWDWQEDAVKWAKKDDLLTND